MRRVARHRPGRFDGASGRLVPATLASTLAIVGGGGCKSPPAAETVVVTASPHASATITPPASSPSPALPLDPRGVDAHLAYLGRMCSPLVQLVSPAGGRAAGCSCCPNYGEPCKPHLSGTPIDESFDTMLTVDQIFRGAFRRPGVDEAVIIVSGCASAAENGGGTWIAGVDRGALRELDYLGGNHPDECQKLPTEEGIDRLLCTFTHGRAATSTHVLVNDYTRPDAGLRARELVEVVSTVSHLCVDRPAAITDNRVIKTTFGDANGDGRVDVSVTVSLRSGRVAPKALAACRDGELQGDPSELLPPAREEILVFLGKPGRAFEPDAATRMILDKI